MYSRGCLPVRSDGKVPLFGKRSGLAYKKGDRGKYQLTVNEKAWKRLKLSLKSITQKTSPLSLKDCLAKIKELQRGWLNYFRGTSIFGKLRDLDSWVRNRLQYCIWKD